MIKYSADIKDFDDLPLYKFSLIPTGEYPAILFKIEQRESKVNRNTYYNCQYKITDSLYEGRFVWDILNLHHPSEKVLNIAKARLKQLMTACSKSHVEDLDTLTNIPLHIEVKIKNNNNIISCVKKSIADSKNENETSIYIPSPTPTVPWEDVF